MPFWRNLDWIMKSIECKRTRVFAVIGFGLLGLMASRARGAAVDAVFNSAGEVPITASGYTATGSTINFTLNFAPAVGTELMVVRNTGLDFIVGTFDNLAQGEAVGLGYGGYTFYFVANYYGGSGNDLVLAWAGSRAFAWGYDSEGQLGDGTILLFPPNGRALPTPVTATGVLAGKSIVALAAGGFHSLAVCSDGTLAAWGSNTSGQVGDNTKTNRLAPVPVNTDAGLSALHGKTVVALAAGWDFSLALCSDGTLAAWGNNGAGQLGDNTTTNRLVPVAVNTDAGVSALSGKTVVAISAGWSHCLALCSDGTIVGWGLNSSGQLGDNTTTNHLVPVAVNTDAGVSALNGKTVIRIAAGGYHGMGLCSDGTLAAWGNDSFGQIGDNSSGNNRLAPMLVNITSGVSSLYGKSVTAIAAGVYHSLALCSDGTVSAWGNNTFGQVGDNTTTRRVTPVLVNTNLGVSALYGKTVVAIAAGQGHNLALCSDNAVAAWGDDSYGQLGDNAYFTQRKAPVAVNTTPLAASQRFIGVAGGSAAYHTLALVAAPVASNMNLVGAQKLASGAFQFTYTNTPGSFFSVLAQTNPALPLSNWSSVTGLTEVMPGQFQFTDPQATNMPWRFYRVRSP